MTKKDTLATFRIDADLWEQFRAKASEDRYSASSLLLGFVTDYVAGNIPGAIPTASDTRIDKRIDEIAHRLESQIDERIEAVKTELESALLAVHSQKKRVTPKRQAESPIGTQELCQRLDINYNNLSTRAKRHNRTTDEQLIAEALEKGQEWQVCDRKGKVMFWERVG